MTDITLLNYYQAKQFNPVHISVEEEAVWREHCNKRRNLYENHLGIPLSFLSDKSVIDFGCNSGENSIVMASVGAKMTLVEPNQQVIPRLNALIDKFGVRGQIAALVEEGVDRFEPPKETLFDLAVAEGFLYTLDNRDDMFRKIAGLIAPGGIGVVSFNDRCGSLLELSKRFIYQRACQLAGIQDSSSPDSIEIARRLFEPEYAALNASRDFSAWCADNLQNPLFASRYLWSYPELMSLIAETGCTLLSTSPRWVDVDSFAWYKNALDPKVRHQKILERWSQFLPFFLTGQPLNSPDSCSASAAAVQAILDLQDRISEFLSGKPDSLSGVVYPSELNAYLIGSSDETLVTLGAELANLYELAQTASSDGLIDGYRATRCMRLLWGTPYHYISFVRNSE